MAVYTILGLYALCSILFMGISIPLIAGRVPRNPLYGFRTPKTLSSDAIWYAANSFMGKELFHCGRLLLGGTVLMTIFARFLTKDQAALIGLAMMMILLLTAVVRGFLYLRRL